ncbi:ArsR/SmtB family transcription factor [Psychrobacillus soli]|uniref:Winged helix-turn-helix transcriptional regulator n=1 Tax=Psychrobacillus soli TaxID=1543965 RepID=A0A544TKA9_9BACI|nr:winged helix-turn-helix domain-containing protein [Psychrobacillus soli]TQR17876.1 winged helix-turn-helix transcriptional regulator [Psychrobacillus soli]
MEVLNLTSRKRETYQVQLKYSVLWECALGIAAITNTPIIKTLEKPVEYWKEIKESLPVKLLVELDYVENKNTWKALLQLLHQRDFTDLKEFTNYIRKLSMPDFIFICIPFIGNNYQELRRNASLGEQLAMKEMMKITKDNSFFPRYIEFICQVNSKRLKEHLISVMTGWYEEVIKKEVEQLHTILQIDYEMKREMADKMSTEELVEWTTGGITYLPELNVSNVLLIPQYIYRPWNIEADLENTKVFYYPIANESITPNDRYTPNNFLVLKHKALGDEVRLRIVKLLEEQNLTLQDITEKLNIGKSTIHHHLKILRAAKLVEIIDAKYALKRNSLDMLSKELEFYLNQ